MALDKTASKAKKILAPARICLFGDHQDYLGLPVIACAINRHITLRAIPNSTEEFIFNLPDIQSNRSFSIDETFDNLKAGDFFASVLRRVKKYDCIPNQGYTITIQGNIPVNAGVSSSSAIVVAWVSFLLHTFGCNQEITSEFISQIAYEAEVLEHNSPGGKMDQYSIGIGSIIFIETGDHFSFKIIGSQMDGLVLGESGISKDTIGLLGSVKTKALEALAIVKKKVPSFNLENATMEDYHKHVGFLEQELVPYFYAAIQNHMITLKALIALSKDTTNLEEIGTLMNQHHTILKDDLNLTVPRIDAMIDGALQAGAYGAKIVGSGGGGCIVAIAPENKKEAVIQAIKLAEAKDAYEVNVAKGVEIYE